MIAAVRTITAKDLRERLRDKSFFLLGVLTPLVLAFVLDLVFGDLGEGELEVRTGVVDVDGSDVSGQLVDALAAIDGEAGFSVTTLEATADPEEAIEEHELDAVVVIPDGFGDVVSLPEGRTPELEIVANPDRTIQAGVVESMVDGYVAVAYRAQLLASTGALLGVDIDPSAALTGDVEVAREHPGGEGLDAGARMVAGMAVMFVFFTVSFGVTTLLSEKETGTLRRLLAAPIPRDSVIAAKGLVSYVLGVLATMILMVASTFLMGAEWGSWPGVLILVLTAVLTAVALMAIVAGIAKTSEGAGGAQAIIAVGLAMLGGSWFPVATDGVMAVVARLTPHYWFLDGLEELARTGTWTSIGTHAAALVAIALVAGVPAALILRRRLTP